MLEAEVSFVGRDEADCTMVVLTVVPSDEAAHPLFCGRDAGKWGTWVGGPVLQGSEEGFRIGIVVRNVRTAEGRDDAEPLQGSQHGAAAHRLAVVGMEDEPVGVDVCVVTDRANHLGGEFLALTLVHLPADDATTPDVEHEV